MWTLTIGAIDEIDFRTPDGAMKPFFPAGDLHCFPGQRYSGHLDHAIGENLGLTSAAPGTEHSGLGGPGRLGEAPSQSGTTDWGGSTKILLEVLQIPPIFPKFTGKVMQER